MAGFHTKTFQVFDDYTTPYSAWENIKQYLPIDKVIWEAFYCNGESGNHLQKLGFNVIHENEDFFENDKGDLIVSNPPFSMKKEVLKRLKNLNKPFILICPISMLNTNYLRDLFGNSIQLLIPRKRIQFNKFEDGIEKTLNSCNFDTAYFCYKMNLERDVIFL